MLNYQASSLEETHKSYSSFHYLSNEIRFLKNRKRSISNILILKVVDLGANLWLLRMLCLWFQSIWRSVQQGAKMIKAAIKIFTETSSTFMWTYQSQKKTSPVSHSSKTASQHHKAQILSLSTIAYKSIPNSNPIFVSWGQHGWNCWG